jgi:hypothetical protein
MEVQLLITRMQSLLTHPDGQLAALKASSEETKE